ncbi:MAG: family 1 glycosylhydrolase [Acidimicrobiales bacterium]
MSLPDDFFLGAGVSPLVARGAARRSDWRRWAERTHRPDAAEGNGFEERFEEDFAVLLSHRLDPVVIGVDWARLEPHAGQIDAAEVEHVVQVFSTARDAGLQPWAQLHDHTLPGWFADDTDGFRSDGPSIHWSRHVDRVAEMLDGLTAAWVPFSDPVGWAVRGHHIGSGPPGPRSTDAMHEAVVGALDATFEGWRLLRSGQAPVVGSFSLPLFHVADEAVGADASAWQDAFWDSWILAVRDGELRLPWQAAIERPDMADAFDAIGVIPSPAVSVDPEGRLTAWPGKERQDDSGWCPPRHDVGEVLHAVGDQLAGREFVAMGLGVTTSDDEWRADLHRAWLESLSEAVADGVNIRGAIFDAAVDGYDPVTGFESGRGLFTSEREPKQSLGWIDAQR